MRTMLLAIIIILTVANFNMSLARQEDKCRALGYVSSVLWLENGYQVCKDKNGNRVVTTYKDGAQ